MNFTNIDFDQLFAMSDDSNPLMMIVWILPIILFVFYGQRIQLYVTSGEIKKAIKKLDGFREESKIELVDYVKKNLNPENDYAKKIDRFLDYFTIMPVTWIQMVLLVKYSIQLEQRRIYPTTHQNTIS